MKCVRQMWKWIFILLTYANMNMEKMRQGYDAKSCLRLMLNKLKEMKGPISIYTHLKTDLKEASNEAFMCATSK
jgi:hypothetical protein